MKRIMNALFISLVLLLSATSCDKPQPQPTPGFDVDIVLPKQVDAYPGEATRFDVVGGKAPLTTDVMLLAPAEGGAVLSCTITKSAAEYIYVKMSKKLEDGYYNVSIKRDAEEKKFGKAYFNIVTPSDYQPDPSSTIWGRIVCGETGVAGVVVSDGFNVVKTNDKGYYEMASKKDRKYVFMSVPSGYEPKADGVFPQIHKLCNKPSDIQERLDFQLVRSTNQTSFQMLAMGDMHLAGRNNNDRAQFRDICADIKAYLATQKGKSVYGVTLGDMTWDIYWVPPCSYSFPSYIADINPQLSGDIKIYHTMGNHDNDYQTFSDWTAEEFYTQQIAPTYYSYNIGEWHFVVLDDINCSNYNGTTARNYYKDVTDIQLDWLQKDIALIPADMPVFLTTHAQFFYPSASDTNKFVYDSATTRTSNTNKVLSILGNRPVHLVTGHSHQIWNVTPGDAIAGGRNLYEHNSGALCGTWWWTGAYEKIGMGPDGCPGGYQIFEFDGKNVKWRYKASGKTLDYQFRTYDRNSIKMSDFYGNASTTSKFYKNSASWRDASSQNYVYINLWNYSKDWTLKVTEDGKELSWTRVSERDPLHMICYWKHAPDGNFGAESTNHMFRVKASSATSTLVITATDPFGNVYTETMQRPKAFSVDTYK